MQNRGYNHRQKTTSQILPMPAQVYDDLTDFGKRLSALRKAAGYTQVELAKELGITQRMVSYYEGESDYPPSALIPQLAKVLNISADELFGIEPVKKNRPPDSRLLRRLQQVEKLSTTKRKQLIQIIDTFIEVEQLKSK